jgi:hypothetical protein
MKVFIGWSGQKSRAVALTLWDWLPNVLQTVEPWMSEEDITKGAPWNAELVLQLNTCHFGIVCVTPENMAAPWLNFEAGALALAKRVDKALVSPFLVGLTPTDLTGPISQFQAVTATLKDVTRLLRSLNNASESPLPDDRITRAAEKWWPSLEEKLQTAAELPPAPPASTRELRDVMDEVLEISRRLQRQISLDDLAMESDEGPDEQLVDQVHDALSGADTMCGVSA